MLTGIGCSAVAFSLTVWAQRTIEPSRASLLNLLEPVVAGVIGYAVGERLGASGTSGAALILPRSSSPSAAPTAGSPAG